MNEIPIEKQDKTKPKLQRTCDLNEIVVVKWVDAHEKAQEWDTMEDTLDWAMESNWIVTQVGFVLFENKDYLLLSSQVCEPEKHVQKAGNATKIPKGWITDRRELR
jgi:hypothetical protein